MRQTCVPAMSPAWRGGAVSSYSVGGRAAQRSRRAPQLFTGPRCPPVSRRPREVPPILVGGAEILLVHACRSAGLSARLQARCVTDPSGSRNLFVYRD